MPPKTAVAALLFAGFAMSLGYGALLPILPDLVRRLSAVPSAGAAIHHTGFVTAAYAGAAFVASLVSGWLSDFGKPRTVIVGALAVGVIAAVGTAFSANLPELYGLRMVSGLAAGAVGPAVQAWLGLWDDANVEWRKRRLVWTAIASTTGFFIGPIAGGFVATASFPFLDRSSDWPVFAMIAAVQALALLVTLAFMRGGEVRLGTISRVAPRRIERLIVPALEIGLIAMAVSAFEVGLAFPDGDAPFAKLEVGALFALCSLVMILVQIGFAVGLLTTRHLRLLKRPAIVLLASGLLGMAFATGPTLHFIFVALVAAAGGTLPLILAHELAAMAGKAAGSAGGLSSGAALVGQMLGPLMASLAVAASGLPASVFLLAAAVGPVLILIGRRQHLALLESSSD